MNKKYLLLAFVVFSFFLVPFLAMAILGGTPPVGAPTITPDPGTNATPIYNAILNIANFLVSIVVLIATIGVVIAGYIFISSGGDTGKVSSARNILIYSLVGAIVGTFALAFVNWSTTGFAGDPVGIGFAILNIRNFLLGLVFVLGTIGVVIAGYIFISSGGDTGKVSSARNILIYSLVGAIVGTFALAFVNWSTTGFAGDPVGIGFAILNIRNFLLGLVFVLGTIGVVIAGYIFVSSGGDTGKVSSARNILIYSLVGVIVGNFALLFVGWATSGFAGDPVGIGTAIGNILWWLATFLITAAVIGVVIAGYIFVSSGGDTGKVSSARQMLIYSLVGAMVGSFSAGLVNWASTGFSATHVTPTALLLGFVTISNWLFSFLLVAGVVGIVISGFNFVFSSGDTGKVASARQMLIYSLVGVLVGGLGNILVIWARSFI